MKIPTIKELAKKYSINFSQAKIARDYALQFSDNLVEWFSKEAELFEEEDTLIMRAFLHTYSYTPTGKVYMPWSSNITKSEAHMDTAGQELLERLVEECDLSLRWEDGDAIIIRECTDDEKKAWLDFNTIAGDE